MPFASGLATDEIANGRRRVRSTSATHISKTSTLALYRCRLACTASCARPAGSAFQRRSACFWPADLGAAAGILDPHARSKAGLLVPRRRLGTCSHASGTRARIQPTKVASPAAPLRATAFPTQDTFHRQAALASRVDPTVGNTVVRAPAPIRPWRDDRSGLGLVVRPQPRPRTTPETRRLLPTSATM